MNLGIMQPYFFPYLGYFQLINIVDCFVLYDNIEYTKKGWINRNRYLCNGELKYITIPIAHDSDYLDIRDRRVSNSFDKRKLKNQIKMAYGKAPFFEKVYPLFCECIDFSDNNLFNYIFYSIKKIVEYLEIETKLVVSSNLGIEREYKGENRVLETCKRLGADCYINPIGGQKLYSRQKFNDENIKLYFMEMNMVTYPQMGKEFWDKLSILDVIMMNSKEEIAEMLEQYSLY